MLQPRREWFKVMLNTRMTNDKSGSIWMVFMTRNQSILTGVNCKILAHPSFTNVVHSLAEDSSVNSLFHLASKESRDKAFSFNAFGMFFFADT